MTSASCGSFASVVTSTIWTRSGCCASIWASPSRASSKSLDNATWIGRSLSCADDMVPEPPSSESQTTQLPGVTLPVLGDLDVQVEVDRRAEHRLDVPAGGRAHLAQPRPLVPDDDPLLRPALDEE